VQLALGTSLMATRSYAAAETGQAYSRALALCRQTAPPGNALPPYVAYGSFISRAPS
jgi:hypothetical protein